MEQIDVAVFAFDPEHRLRIVNRTGERLMGKSMEHMLGRTAEELSLTEWFGDAPRVVDISLRRRPGDGKSDGRRSGWADCRMTCWCSRTSAGRCANRNARRGSG